MIKRLVGVLGTAERPVIDLVQHYLAHFRASGCAEPQTVMFPQANPVFAVVYAPERRPQVTAFQAPDGSIAAVDGEIFNLSAIEPDGPGGDPNDPQRAVRSILAHLGRRGFSGLGELDSQAIVLRFDAKTQELIVGRDIHGAAPLFFSEHQGRLIFASEIGSLLSAGIDRALDLRSVDFLMGYGYSPAPWSYVKSVGKIPMGYGFTARPGQSPQLARHFLPKGTPYLNPSREERLAEIGRLLADSVARRSGPGTTGVLLSGGVDSALVLGVLSKVLGRKAETFTFSYGDYAGEYNEGDVAAEIAKHYGAKHALIQVNPGDIRDNIRTLVDAYGEPFTFGLHSFAMKALKDAGLTHALNGSGSDGFSIDDSGLYTIWFSRLPKPLRAATQFMASTFKPVLPKVYRRGYSLLWSDRNNLLTAIHPPNMTDEERRPLFVDRGAFDRTLKETHALLREISSEWDGEPVIDAWRHIATHVFSAECMNFWNTAWSRRYDISLRFPFQDRALQSYMNRISGNGYGKTYLREYAETLLPERNARMPKIAQTIPIGNWLRGPLRDMMHDYLTPARIGDIFDTKTVADMIAGHAAGNGDHTWPLLSLITFSVWRETVLERLPSAQGTLAA